MPTLTVEGYGTFEVVDGKRLVLAIEKDAGVDILHACGGTARCTSCRARSDRRAPVMSDSLRPRYGRSRHQPARRIRPPRCRRSACRDDHPSSAVGLRFSAARDARDLLTNCWFRTL